MANTTQTSHSITVKISDIDYRLLSVLCDGGAFTSVEEIVLNLIDHAQQGVYRPGAWERMWLCQAFGDDWLDKLKPGDPYGRPDCDSIFQEPKGPGEGLSTNR